jgi:hypothetical protein
MAMKSDKRRASRREQHFRAWIEHEEKLIPCILVDISETGAKISGTIPSLKDAFVLRLTQDGKVRRAYQVVWHTPGEAGVRLVAKLQPASIDIFRQD